VQLRNELKFRLGKSGSGYIHRRWSVSISGNIGTVGKTWIIPIPDTKRPFLKDTLGEHIPPLPAHFRRNSFPGLSHVTKLKVVHSIASINEERSIAINENGPDSPDIAPTIVSCKSWQRNYSDK
jgi:hypothetical protein